MCRKSPLQRYELFINFNKKEYFSMVRSVQNCYMWGTDVIYFLSEHISNTYIHTNLMLDFTMLHVHIVLAFDFVFENIPSL